MPQLEGQPGSRGMNPPGGVSTINLYNWSEPTPTSRRNNQSNDDNVSQRMNESTPFRSSAGLSPRTNPNGGITRMHQAPDSNNSITFGVPSSPSENDTSLKRRPGYDEKRKEMYGSGIFNETSGSCDDDAGYGGFVDKVPTAIGENQKVLKLKVKNMDPQQPRGRIQSDAKHKELFGSTPDLFQEQRYRPASDAKAKELNGNNIFGYSNYDYRPPSGRFVQEPEDQRSPRQHQFNNNNHGSHSANDEYQNFYEGPNKREISAGRCGSNENLSDMAGRLTFSNAKARELVGDNIFGLSPSNATKVANYNREPAGKRSQLMHNNRDPSEHPNSHGKKNWEMKSGELVSGNNIFHGRNNNSSDDLPQYQQRSLTKVKEMSGSDIFSNDQPKARNTVGGIRKPPGGGSTVVLA